jgi:hypothetical protein
MFPLYRRAFATVIAALLMAVAVPAAMAQPTDLRSPDARDAAAAAQPAQDLRSPDAQDFAAGRQIVASTPVQVAKAPSDTPAPSGFDWGDAALGAGGALGLALVGVGGTVALMRRRRVTSTRSAGLVG